MLIYPSVAAGTMKAPPSKSMAHRYIICAALSGGKSILENVALSEDIKATLNCIKLLGADYTVSGDTVEVIGANCAKTAAASRCAPTEASPSERIFPCNESGSTLRFFIPLALLSAGRSVFTGSSVLLSRPLSVYEDIFSRQNILFERKDGRIEVEGRLKADDFSVPGNISSQFITGLLFTLPLLDKDSTITLTGTIESKPYIDMTLQVQADFGIKAYWKDERTLFIAGNQAYKSTDAQVEGDYSNAAFFEALNAIGGSVKIDGLREDSLQGDKVYKELFSRLKNAEPLPAGAGGGARQTEDARVTEASCVSGAARQTEDARVTGEACVCGAARQTEAARDTEEACVCEAARQTEAARVTENSPLTSAAIDISDCPDLGPVLFSVAAALNGGVFTGTKRLEIKESNRGKVMCEELAKFGIKTRMEDNSITIYPGTLKTPLEILSGHNDHRIVMSLVTLLTITGGRIEGVQAVKKSLPDYFSRIKKLGIRFDFEGETYGLDN